MGLGLGFCCCGGLRILVVNSALLVNDEMAAYYEANWGATVDFYQENSEPGDLDITPYRLIFWLRSLAGVVSVPAWTSQVPDWLAIGGKTIFVGSEVLAAGEFGDLNATLGDFGTAIILVDPGLAIDSGCFTGAGWPGNVQAHDLTNGCSTIKYANTAKVSGGSLLLTNLSAAHNIMAAEEVTGSYVVVAGDTDIVSDVCTGPNAIDNACFLDNLVSVIP